MTEIWDYIDTVIFSFAGLSITVEQVLSFLLAMVAIFASYKIVMLGALPYFYRKEVVSEDFRKKNRTSIKRIFGPIALIVFLKTFDLDYVLSESAAYTFHISTLVFGVIIIQLARIFDALSTKALLKQYQASRGLQRGRQTGRAEMPARATRTVQYIVYTIAIIALVSAFNLNKTLIQIPMKDDVFPLKVNSIFVAVLVFLLATLLAWVVTQLLLFSYYRRHEIDPGKRFAINQLVTYFIYVIALFVIVDNLGIQLTVLWGGIAALLVGVGLGMQDIFKDFISGIILLSDRTVEVHDVVTINNQIGEIRKIGLRTSFVLGRDDTMLIIPNSRLISDQVINWTQQDRKVRFSVKVGVAYGSDPQLIKKILLRAVSESDSISNVPAPFVRFKDFGDSSLDFEVFFWSYHLMDIENVISDLRFTISRLFQEAGVTIPFPQHDLWIRNSDSQS